METLWAPWRMQYISKKVKEEGCIFCLGVTDNPVERGVLFKGLRSLVMMNKYPYINGHLLVAPLRHVAVPDHLDHPEMVALLTMISNCLAVLKKEMKAEGFNVGLNLGNVAGAGVEDHLHFHIVPRWNGDTNFMTVLGEVRVIPEHMEQTYYKLLSYFQKMKEDAHAYC
jgi:ATP adenylyltransferase